MAVQVAAGHGGGSLALRKASSAYLVTPCSSTRSIGRASNGYAGQQLSESFGLRGGWREFAVGCGRVGGWLRARAERAEAQLEIERADRGVGGNSRKRNALAAIARSVLVIIFHLLADPETRFRDLGPATTTTASAGNARS
jgi:transposase